MPILKTYQQWKDAGFQVQKGQHASTRDLSGLPLFKKSQVKPKRSYSHDVGDYDINSMEEDYDRFMDEYGYDRDWT